MKAQKCLNGNRGRTKRKDDLPEATGSVALIRISQIHQVRLERSIEVIPSSTGRSFGIIHHQHKGSDQEPRLVQGIQHQSHNEEGCEGCHGFGTI